MNCTNVHKHGDESFDGGNSVVVRIVDVLTILIIIPKFIVVVSKIQMPELLNVGRHGQKETLARTLPI